MQAATPGSLQDLGPLVFRDDALHLHQQLIFRARPERAVHEHHVHAAALQFLQQHHLVSVAPRQAIRRQHIQTIDRAGRRLVTQPFQGRAHQRRATDTVVAKTQVGFQCVPVRFHAGADS